MGYLIKHDGSNVRMVDYKPCSGKIVAQETYALVIKWERPPPAFIDRMSVFEMKSISKQGPVWEHKTVYGTKLEHDRMEKALRDVLRAEHARALIIHNAGTGPVTVPRLSELTRIPADEVLRHLSVMMKQSRVALSGHDGADPLFQVVQGSGVG